MEALIEQIEHKSRQVCKSKEKAGGMEECVGVVGGDKTGSGIISNDVPLTELGRAFLSSQNYRLEL